MNKCIVCIMYIHVRWKIKTQHIFWDTWNSAYLFLLIFKYNNKQAHKYYFVEKNSLFFLLLCPKQIVHSAIQDFRDCMKTIRKCFIHSWKLTQIQDLWSNQRIIFKKGQKNENKCLCAFNFAWNNGETKWKKHNYCISMEWEKKTLQLFDESSYWIADACAYSTASSSWAFERTCKLFDVTCECVILSQFSPNFFHYNFL